MHDLTDSSKERHILTSLDYELNSSQKNELKFINIFNTLSDSVLIHPLLEEGFTNFIDVNDTACQRYGYSKKEFLSLKATDITIKNDVEQHAKKKYRRKLLEKGKLITESVHITKDGERFPVEINSNVVDFKGQKLIVAVVRDISERKEAELKLRKSEERNKALLKAIPDILFRINKELVFIDCHVQNIDALLIPPHKIIGFKCKDVLSPELYELTKQKVKETFASMSMVVYDYSIIFKGQNNWYNARMVPCSKDEVLVIIRNVTEDKLTLTALTESEERYRAMFYHSKSIMLMIDPETQKIVDANDSALEFYKYSLQEITVLYVYDLNVLSKQEIKEEIECARTEKRNFFVFQHRIKTGEIKHVQVYSGSIFIGKREFLYSIIHDITEQKITETALIESQRLGAIGEMASAVAHDFNNSLQSIYANIELALMQDHISVSLKKYLETIKTVTSDAAERIKVIQRFSGKNQRKDEHKTLNFNGIISDVITQSRPIWKDDAEKNGLQIIVKPTYGNISNVLGNASELRSVLYNLIKNSVEAMPNGGTIDIETREKDEGVLVTISDNGIGMNDEVRTRVFQPFFSTKGFEAGRGLGMSGAFTIIKEHGGTIYIKDTSLNYGTTIEIILPHILQQNAPKEEREKTIFDGVAKILWVDDDKMIRNVIVEILDVLGHKADIALNGEEALKFLEQNSYDLVVTDIGMPGMNGWQLASIIKNKFAGKQKVAVLTGWGTQITDEERQNNGVDFVLEKPAKFQQIEELINKVMEQKNSKIIN